MKTHPSSARPNLTAVGLGGGWLILASFVAASAVCAPSWTAQGRDAAGATATSPPVKVIVTSGELLPLGSLKREVYSNIPGVLLADLTNNAKFPDHPDLVDEVASFEAPSQFADNYGQRLSGFLLPPITGDYVFYLASDDQGALFLSTDKHPVHKVQIAADPLWSPPRSWTSSPTRTNSANVSIPIRLVAGQKYYVEALHKEGGGGDNLGVAWQKPGDPVPANGDPPIPGQYLASELPHPPTNWPPTVTITSPTNGAVFATGSDILITPDAVDAEDGVSTVELFAGTTRLGEATKMYGEAGEAWTFIWSNVPPASYVLTARVTDNVGQMGVSAPVNITVREGEPATFAAPGDQEYPAVAGSGTNYLVVWLDHRSGPLCYDIYAARVGLDGRVLDPAGIPVCTNGAWQFDPSVAFDGTNYLVVWRDNRNDHGDPNRHETFGARVSRDGRVLDPDGIRITRDEVSFQPTVAFNGTDYLIVSYAATHNGVPGGFILGSRVTTAGVVRDVEELVLFQTDHFFAPAVVASAGGDSLVVWNDIGTWGRIVHPDGSMESPRQLDAVGSTGIRGLTAAGGNYFLATGHWRDLINNTAVTDLWGTRVSLQGIVQTNFLLRAITNAVIGNGSNLTLYTQESPAVTLAGADVFVVWETGTVYTNDTAQRWRSDIMSLRVTPLNTVLLPIPVCTAPQEQSHAAVVAAPLSGAIQLLAVWQDARSAPVEVSSASPFFDIYGARLSMTGGPIETNGFLISTSVRQTPILTWPAPAPIVYSTPLGPQQFNVSVNVPGTFRFHPLLGTLLRPGEYNLAVTFTPQDTNAYDSFTETVNLTVERAPLTIRADNKTKTQGQPNPPLTATYTGFVNGDTPAGFDTPVTLTTMATTTSPVGAYPIVASGTSSPDYDITHDNGLLTILPRSTGPGSVDVTFDPTAGGTLEGVGGNPAAVQAILPLPEGKVLIGGYFASVNGEARPALARLNADGTLDRSFLVPAFESSVVTALARQPNGKIIAGGWFTDTAGNEFHLLRFNSQGSLDLTFHLDAVLTYGVSVIVLQPDGKILIGGEFGLLDLDNNLLFYQIARLNADGTLDTSFDPGTDIQGGEPAIQALVLQADGRILIGGDFTGFQGVAVPSLARLNVDGSLDPTFHPDPAKRWNVTAIALQADGKMLVGGSPGANGSVGPKMVRLNSDGSVDSHFQLGLESEVAVYSIMVQPDERILIAGFLSAIPGFQGPSLLRLNSDGSLDGAFARISTGIAPITAMALQRDGRLFIGGSFDQVNGIPHHCIARLNTGLPAREPPGSVDLTFDLTGGGQWPGISGGSWLSVLALAAQPDGRVIVGGEFAGFNGRLRLNLARVLPDGALDPSFDTAWGADGSVGRVVAQPDGRILIAGSFNTVHGVPRHGFARLNSDGTLDPDFAPVVQPAVSWLALAPDGRIVISGNYTDTDGLARATLARLLPDGSLDTSFDASSVVSGDHVNIRDVAVQPDGRVLVWRSSPAISDAGRLIRLNTDGTLDASFDVRLTTAPAGYSIGTFLRLADGRIIVNYFYSPGSGGTWWQTISRLNADGSLDAAFNPARQPINDFVTSMVEQPDGKLLLAGNFKQVYGTLRRGLARLNSDGSLDTGFNQNDAVGARPQTGGGDSDRVSTLALLPGGQVVIGMFADYQRGTNCLFQVDSNGVRNGAFRTALTSMWSPTTDLVPLPDGKTLLCGYFTSINGVPWGSLARLNADGTLDRSFAPDIGGYVECLARQSDGLILLGGYFTNYNGTPCTSLVRIRPDGGLDPEFSPPGPAWAWNSGIGSVGLSTLEADAGILIGGSFDQVNGAPRHFFARLRSDGTLDPTPVLEPSGWPQTFGFTCMGVQSDGKVLIGGQYDDYANGTIPYRALVRYNADGTLDEEFMDRCRVEGNVEHLIIQPDDKLLLLGGLRLLVGAIVNGVAVSSPARLNRDGTVDTNFFSAVQGWGSMALQRNGKILVNTSDGVCRLNPDGSLDADFRARLSPWGANWAEASVIAVQPDGQILISGQFTAVNGVPALNLARLNGNAVPRSFVLRRIASPLVQLAATPPDGTSVYAVEDQPPAGWMVRNISHSGVFDTVTGKVKFGPFFDAEPRTLSYDVLPPPGAQGVFLFTGTASADGLNSVIGGDQHYVIPGFHPADFNLPDWTMSMAEVTAYGAAWRRGQSWPLGPVPIPIDYLTRAAALWKGGECYTVDISVANAPLWWVNCPVPERQGAAVALALGASTAVVERRLPPVYVPGEPVSVSISASPASSTTAYAVEEQIPAGWAVTNISHNGALDAINGKVKWGPFLDNAARTLSYSATPPCAASDTVLISGVSSFDGVSTPINGPCQLSEAKGYDGLALAEALDAAELVWRTDELKPWFSQTNVTHDGVDAARTGSLTDHGESWLETDVNGPGIISYWWKVSTIKDWYFLSFRLDGETMANITGETDWHHRSFFVPPGQHTLRWDYSRYDDETGGQDAGWLDQVSFTTNAPAIPTIVTAPQSQSVTAGDDLTFVVVPDGTEPFNYQWRFNGTNLLGEIGPFLHVTNAELAQAGFYDVVVGNVAGNATSAAATLTVSPCPVAWEWAHRGGGVGSDGASAVAVDQAGNVYVGGQFSGVAAFGTNTLTGSNSDLFLAKLDRQGNLLWVTNLSDGGSATLTSLETDGAGHVIMAGYYLFSLSVGTNQLPAGPARFVAKVDQAGHVLWASSFDGTPRFLEYAGPELATDSSGDLYVLATFESDTSVAGVTLTSVGGSDFFLAKFAPDGVVQWVQTFGTTNWDVARNVAVDSAGHVYFSGEFDGALSVGTNTLVGPNFDGGASHYGIFIAKCDTEGEVLWAQLGETNYFHGYDLAVDAADHLYVRAAFYGTTRLGSSVLTSLNEGGDYFLARLNAEGRALWGRHIGNVGFGSARGYRLATDRSHRVYLQGLFNNNVVVDGKMLFYRPELSSFLAAWDSAGQLLWTEKLPRSVMDFAPDAAGNVFVAGTFNSPISLGTNLLVSSGGDDAFVAKLANVEPLRFASQSASLCVSNGQFLLHLLGCGGRGSVVIEASTNLLNWTAVLTNAMPVEPLEVFVPMNLDQPARFYRARQIE